MEASNSVNGKWRYRRHNPHQTHTLGTFFNENPYPDEEQQNELGRQLGLDQRQIIFWFQNKRSQIKVKFEKADNNTLRAENFRIRSENTAIREALKNAMCPSCGATSFTQEEREHNLEKLRLENAQLREEHERLSIILAAGYSKPKTILWQGAPFIGSSFHPLSGNSLNEGIESPDIDLDFGSGSLISNNNVLPDQKRGIADMQKLLMSESATGALKELVTLLCTDEPLWVKSAANGRFTLNRHIYDKLFHRAYHFKSFTARVESSKETRTVCMSGKQLLEIFLDSGKWVDLFPTIVSKAKTIEVLKSGSIAHRNGALQLMYEQIHFLSPFVPPQEFTLLRKCEQVDFGVWVVADISFDFTNDNTSPPLTWKRPSGCIIRDLPKGSSEVTWVQHVEVDDQTQTHHQLFTAPVYSNFAYEAERWVVTLQMMSERFAYWLNESAKSHEAAGVINSPEGRRGIMNLTHRMVKSLCETLNMPANLDLPQLSEVNNSEFKISVRENTEPGQRGDVIISATTSLWLPLPPQNAFNFFLDEKRRVQWDVLCNGNPVHKIAHISNGTRPGNCISIIQSCIPDESNAVVLQETCIDPMGSLIVYAPIDISAINFALRGEDSSIMPILPSGFVIFGDGRPNTRAGASTSENGGRSGGSLLAMVFQISVNQINMDSVATIKTLMSSTVEAIKFSFNC